MVVHHDPTSRGCIWNGVGDNMKSCDAMRTIPLIERKGWFATVKSVGNRLADDQGTKSL